MGKRGSELRAEQPVLSACYAALGVAVACHYDQNTRKSDEKVAAQFLAPCWNGKKHQNGKKGVVEAELRAELVGAVSYHYDQNTTKAY